MFKDDKHFYEGFVMALRAEGVGWVDTRSDGQHRRFRPVAELVNSRSDVGRIMLNPGWVTDRFTGLDNAFLGLLGYYTHHEMNHGLIVYDRSVESASSYLDEHYTKQEVEFLRQAARVWIGEEPE